MTLMSFFPLQGFNRLVAIALLFMAEEDAFWCLVYIIEHLMPAEYYSRDKQLIGAQVDQVSFFQLFLANWRQRRDYIIQQRTTKTPT